MPRWRLKPPEIFQQQTGQHPVEELQVLGSLDDIFPTIEMIHGPQQGQFILCVVFLRATFCIALVQYLGAGKCPCHQDALGQRSMIDFVLMASDLRPYVLDTQVKRGAELSTDYHLVVSWICWHGRKLYSLGRPKCTGLLGMSSRTN